MQSVPNPIRRHICGVLLVALVSAVCGLVWPAAGSAGPSALPDPCSVAAYGCVEERFYIGGSGSGTLTISPGGKTCTSSCDVTFVLTSPSLVVTVTGSPSPGSVACFHSCPGPSTYAYTINAGRYGGVAAYEFELISYPLTVTKSGAGTGSVKGANGAIDCGTKCSANHVYGDKVTLTATADAGAVFKSWTGACNGQGATCNLTIQQATSTNAVFDLAGSSTTTPPSSTTGGQTGGGQQSGSAADAAVDVDVIGAAGGLSKIGKRVVKLELSLDENVSAKLTLLRRGNVLASKQFARVKEGNRVLTMLVPAGVKKGKAGLAFELKDGQGNTLTGKRTVSVKNA